MRDHPTIGASLAHYKILERIGAGGMGEVFAADDRRLHRKVALKLLPRELASDPSRRERFEREAKAVAALNHPNIVTIYSIDEAEGVQFLTMELVLGKNLDHFIPAGGMPLDRFFDLAVPIADALSAAHARGIAHRDLKPGNIMVTGDGRVKVLDFGLAKLLQEAPEAESSESPTESGTAEGELRGTVPYMSPEQAQGRSVDHRSDIFSLGVILHELATGERPFQGECSAEILSSILRDAARPVTGLRPDLPRHLARIVRRCLEKDPGRRYQVTQDLRNDLEDLRKEIVSESPGSRTEAETRPSRAEFTRAASLADVRLTGSKVVSIAGHAVVLFSHGERIYAVDNRCPHMGFPLDRGTVKDCILTCHWHHARFDLASGGTFDPWADDVRVFPVEVRGDEVWVDVARRR